MDQRLVRESPMTAPSSGIDSHSPLRGKQAAWRFSSYSQLPTTSLTPCACCCCCLVVRSHRAIIEVPSRLFYDDQLLECVIAVIARAHEAASGLLPDTGCTACRCADPAVTSSMLDWELLAPPTEEAAAAEPPFLAPTSGPCPVLFWGVVGEDLHEVRPAARHHLPPTPLSSPLL